MKPLFSLAAFALSLLPFSAALHAADKDEAIIDETIALARSYLGGDEKLDAIHSLRYQGVLVYGNGQSGTIESVFKRPNLHQFISVIGAIKETSTLNKTEGWQKMERLDDPGAWTLDFYEVDDLRQMQATVADTFGFLKRPTSRNGRVEYLGTEDVEGRAAHVLMYYQRDNIWFRRYIDSATGRVLRMVNNKGVVFTESGEKEVDGVRFPAKVIVSFLTEQGEQRMEISYSNIEVNGNIDTARFKVPVMSN